MGKIIGAIEVDNEKCKGCEICITACATKVIGMSPVVNGKGYRFAYMENPANCNGCTNCAIVCPDGVIKVYRMKTEVSLTE